MAGIKSEAIDLLKELIRRQSYSGLENETADLIANFLLKKEIPIYRIHNNIIARNHQFDKNKKTIVLNSHHDTVKVVNGWTKDPFGALFESGKLFGLGSNDAGASLVSLLSSFIYFYKADLSFNLVIIASGEEENFGPNGLSSVLKDLDFTPSLAIVGEPTEMHMAVAEKGLIVIDAEVVGQSGHAARDTGLNAIYEAQSDLAWIQNYSFPRVSDVLGKVKMTVTQINAGTQHNVIPDLCSYVIDVRVNELYTNQEIIDIIDANCKASLTPRSMKWEASGIRLDHPIVQKGVKMGRKIFGSPTLSDQVHFTCPSIKIGPGRSERSHTADEFIETVEVEKAIDIYIKLLDKLTI